jgi:hypothetical protein
MGRLVLASLLVCALCVPVLAAAEDLDPASAAYVQTMAAFGITASSPGSGADVAVGHGSAEPCPPGAPPPPFPGFCSTSPRDFHFAATSNLAADHAAGVFHETGTMFCTAPNECFEGSFRGRVNCLTATGNLATMGIRIEQTSLPTFVEGEQIFVSVIDNGRQGDPVPDLISLNFRRPAVVVVGGQCPDVATTAYQTVVDGDIMVRDGQVTSS